MTKKRKLLVLGYFGYVSNQLDGQTIKTRSIYELLDEKKELVDYELSFFDTQTFQQNKFNVLSMFKAVWKSDILFYIPAHNNLKFFFPLIFAISKIKRIPIHYVVVGGWLADFIKNKPLHIYLLSKINGIYPQTLGLSQDLITRYKFANVFQLNNFRIRGKALNQRRDNERIEKQNNKLVFMARVQPLKGVDTLFSLADDLISQNIDYVSIDIYGPISKEYELEFEMKLKETGLIQYKGVLQPDQIHDTLSKYDLMLFPTMYFTEGFPGSILDAYIAGIPVVATKWKYAQEFIEQGISGVITPFNDEKGFNQTVIELIKKPNEIQDLKNSVQEFAFQFSPQAAWNILEKNVFNLKV